MCLRNSFFTFLFLLSCVDVFSQVVTITETNLVQVSGRLKEYTLTSFLPHSIKNRQRVIDVRFSPKEPVVFTENGTTYYRFVFDESDNISSKQFLEIKVEYDIELFAYDLSWAKYYKDGIGDTFNINRYLEKEYFEKISEKYRE